MAQASPAATTTRRAAQTRRHEPCARDVGQKGVVETLQVRLKCGNRKRSEVGQSTLNQRLE